MRIKFVFLTLAALFVITPFFTLDVIALNLLLMSQLSCGHSVGCWYSWYSMFSDTIDEKGTWLSQSSS